MLMLQAVERVAFPVPDSNSNGTAWRWLLPCPGRPLFTEGGIQGSEDWGDDLLSWTAKLITAARKEQRLYSMVSVITADTMQQMDRLEQASYIIATLVVLDRRYPKLRRLA
jgi:hypothetical protein